MKQSFQIHMQFDEEGEELETLIAKFLIAHLYQTGREEENARSKIPSSNLY